MILSTTTGPLEDLEFLARSEHRVAVLEALAERPTSRADLPTKTGASASTIGAFDERNWIRRDGNRYEATQLGAFVAAGLRNLLARLETERALRDNWQFLPEASGFTVEMVSRAVVTAAEPDAPYRPVNRFAALLGRTDRFRFVGADVALLEPCKDELRRSIVDGMDAEIIDPPAVVAAVIGLAIALPMHYMDLFAHDWLTHLGPIYLATIVFVAGAVLASRGLRADSRPSVPGADTWS